MSKLKIILQQRLTSNKEVYDFVAYVNKNINKSTLFGCGVSMDKKTAQKRAIFEALERYYSSIKPDSKEIFKYSIRELEHKKISHFLPHKVSNKKITIDWVKGTSLPEKTDILVPAATVYLKHPQNNFINFVSNSVGIAIHKSLNKAITSSIFELFERKDAQFVWDTKTNLMRIDMKSIKDKKIQKLANYLNKQNLEPFLFLTTNRYGIKTSIGGLFNKNIQYPVMAFGLASGIKVNEIFKKSIEETIMIHNSLKIIDKQEIRDKKINQVKSPIDRIIFYAKSKNLKYLNFLLAMKPLKLEAVLRGHKFKNRNLGKIDIADYLTHRKMGMVIVPMHKELAGKHKMYLVRSFLKNNYLNTRNTVPYPFG